MAALPIAAVTVQPQAQQLFELSEGLETPVQLIYLLTLLGFLVVGAYLVVRQVSCKCTVVPDYHWSLRCCDLHCTQQSRVVPSLSCTGKCLSTEGLPKGCAVAARCKHHPGILGCRCSSGETSRSQPRCWASACAAAPTTARCPVALSGQQLAMQCSSCRCMRTPHGASVP